MKTWSFYDIQTGARIDRTYSGDDLAANTPAGTVAVEGVPDPVPIPQRDVARRSIKAQIRALEAQQLRPLRELALNPNHTIARERITELDARIAALREQL